MFVFKDIQYFKGKEVAGEEQGKENEGEDKEIKKVQKKKKKKNKKSKKNKKTEEEATVEKATVEKEATDKCEVVAGMIEGEEDKTLHIEEKQESLNEVTENSVCEKSHEELVDDLKIDEVSKKEEQQVVQMKEEQIVENVEEKCQTDDLQVSSNNEINVTVPLPENFEKVDGKENQAPSETDSDNAG